MNKDTKNILNILLKVSLVLECYAILIVIVFIYALTHPEKSSSLPVSEAVILGLYIMVINTPIYLGLIIAKLIRTKKTK